MDRLRWQLWLPQPGSQGAGSPPWWGCLGPGPPRHDCGGSLGKRCFLRWLLVVCALFSPTCPWVREWTCVSSTHWAWGEGKGGRRTACSTGVDLGVPGLTFDLGIVPTGLPSGLETSRGPCWPRHGACVWVLWSRWVGGLGDHAFGATRPWGAPETLGRFTSDSCSDV